MIIIINGSVGVGKTTTAWKMISKFDKAVMLDGDFIGAVHPFEIYDKNRIDYLYQTLLHLIKFHQKHHYQHFVINYVFESHQSLEKLTKYLKETNLPIYVFWLTASDKIQRQRIKSRGMPKDEEKWSLNRFKQLNKIQKEASHKGFIGEKINTDNLSPEKVVDEVWERIKTKRSKPIKIETG